MLIGSNHHPWFKSEPDFQLLKNSWFKLPVDATELADAFTRLEKRCGATAAALLGRHGVQVPTRYAEDIAFQLFSELVRRGFAACENARPLHPYAYRILERICIATRRKLAIRREVSLPDELKVAINTDCHIEAVDCEEEFERLRWAIELLPPPFRDTIRRLLDEPHFIRMLPNKAEQKRQHNLLSGARRRLKRILELRWSVPASPRIRKAA
jgi:DNA-directed RNA polymerase specialized sigma24 family protein